MMRSFLFHRPTPTERLSALQLLSQSKRGAHLQLTMWSTVSGLKPKLAFPKVVERAAAMRSRFDQEWLLAAYECWLSSTYHLELSARQIGDFWFETGLGLYGLEALFLVWSAAAKRFHSELLLELPESVELCLFGPSTSSSHELLNGAARLLFEDVLFEEQKRLDPPKLIELRHQVVRQWCDAVRPVSDSERNELEVLLVGDWARRQPGHRERATFTDVPKVGP